MFGFVWRSVFNLEMPGELRFIISFRLIIQGSCMTSERRSYHISLQFI